MTTTPVMTGIMMMRTTMMTSDDPIERNAARIARIHRLSDPLAAMGQRTAATRLRQERNARIALLVLSLTATLAITGAITALTDPGESAPSREVPPVLVLADDDGPVDVSTGSS